VTEPAFDELVHAPTRLSILALLAGAEALEFRFIRDRVGLSDSALSKQVSTLEEAGYVDVTKGFVGKRARTWIRLTADGRAAFEGHVAALQQIVATAGGGLQVPAGEGAHRQ
jgi:DNA-binding MarR family transcriptional regulator